jgi:hypothetical protein
MEGNSRQPFCGAAMAARLGCKSSPITPLPLDALDC